MSGTFNNINVPPTLVSFAVDVAGQDDLITPEFKEPGDKLAVFSVPKDEFDIPVYKDVMAMYDEVSQLIAQGRVKAAYVLDAYGIPAAVSKMGFGNGYGAEIDSDIEADELFANRMGDILVEIDDATEDEFESDVTIIGEVTDGDFVYGDVKITQADALSAWKKKLEKIYPSKAGNSSEKVDMPVYNAGSPEEYSFSGVRVKRGLYQTSKGMYLNADVNGALNILKKSNVADLSVLYARGQVDSPLRIRIA